MINYLRKNPFLCERKNILLRRARYNQMIVEDTRLDSTCINADIEEIASDVEPLVGEVLGKATSLFK
ncbi:MAG: hypothetical protein P4L61_00370, partial [Candidatus Pacebacteria bacterium]|nr:hypothetical protein [Candidatus Paceibacterota bacterium]